MFKTRDGRQINVTELKWSEIQLTLLRINPELIRIIDKINDKDDLFVYKARYPYGANIISNSMAYFPLADGGEIAFNNPSLPETLIKNLNYSPLMSSPMGVILNKNCEIYIRADSRIMPHMVMSPGDIFGVSRALANTFQLDSNVSLISPPAMWDISSGARSVFMLTKIANTIGHNKLKKRLGLDIRKPESYQEHYSLFKQIAQSPECDWYSEVLFFSNKWLERLGSTEFRELFSYLSQVNRYFNRVWHNTPQWTMVFNEIENKHRLWHYSPYTLATAKHLFNIASGSIVGFRPANDDSSAPVELIQDMYLNTYELDDYWPIIMEPMQFSHHHNDLPLYYSLNFPTLAQCNPTTFKGKSLIALEDEVERTVEKYHHDILRAKDIIYKSTSLYNTALAADFSFFHEDPGAYNNIQPAQAVLEQDPRFFCKHNSNATFPLHSAFLKGCVKINPRPRPQQ